MTKRDGLAPECSLLAPLTNATLDDHKANSTNQRWSRLLATPYHS